MSKIWILTIAVAIGISAGSLGLVWLGVRNRLDIHIPRHQFIDLAEKTEVLFTPKHDNLNIVLIPLKNPSWRNTDEFRFSIVDSSGEELRSIEFSGQNVRDPEDVRFQFDPISNSAGRSFMIRLERESKSEPPIGFAVDESGNLAFVSYYRIADRKEALLSLGRFWKGRLAENLGFFIVWTFILTGTVWLGKEQK